MWNNRMQCISCQHVSLSVKFKVIFEKLPRLIDHFTIISALNSYKEFKKYFNKFYFISRLKIDFCVGETIPVGGNRFWVSKSFRSLYLLFFRSRRPTFVDVRHPTTPTQIRRRKKYGQENTGSFRQVRVGRNSIQMSRQNSQKSSLWEC